LSGYSVEEFCSENDFAKFHTPKFKTRLRSVKSGQGSSQVYESFSGLIKIIIYLCIKLLVYTIYFFTLDISLRI